MASCVDTLKELIVATSKSDKKLDAEVETLMIESASKALLNTKSSDKPSRYLERTLSVKALTNLMDSEARCRTLLSNHLEVVLFCLKEIMRMSKLQDMDSEFWKVLVDFLSNVSRWEFAVQEMTKLSKDDFDLEAVMGCLSSSSLEAFLPLVLNLSQSSEVRRSLCQEPHYCLSTVLPFLSQEHESETRKFVAGIAKNICFEDGCHQQIVSSSCTDALAVILSCLVSHTDLDGGIDDEDFADLPSIVQSALKEPNRKREPNEEVRLRLVRALLQLCATPVGREALGEANAYVVLRELYKWEGDYGSRSVLLEAQHIIDVLITEAEPNPEQVVPDYDKTANFRHVTMTEEDVKLVERVDKEFLEK